MLTVIKHFWHFILIPVLLSNLCVSIFSSDAASFLLLNAIEAIFILMVFSCIALALRSYAKQFGISDAKVAKLLIKYLDAKRPKPWFSVYISRQLNPYM